MIAVETLLARAKAHRTSPNPHGATTADVLETAAWDVGLYHKAKALIEERLATMVAADAVAAGQFPFGMDAAEGRLYLSGKAEALQWVLEMLP